MRTSYAAASLLMTGVLDNLGSLRKLIGEPMPAIGPAVITRSALEIGATVWWLMQPGIGARARTCRQLVLSLTSARRAGQVAGELGDSEGRDEGFQQEDRVLQLITDLTIAPPTGTNRYSPVIEGERCPSATELTATMLRPCYPGLVGTESFYRTHSAVTHGEIYGLMNFMTTIEQLDGKTLLTWQLRGSVLYSTIELAIVSFREPFKRIHQHMNWGHLEHDLWTVNVQKALGIATRPRASQTVGNEAYRCAPHPR